MNLIKPPRLRKGDVIGVCAPASPPAGPGALEKGIEYLEGLGYRVHLAKNLYRKHGYLAGTDAQRAADLRELFSNRHVKAIIAARGGFGTQRLLPLLDFRNIRRHPKIVVGYSDITALQLALFTKTGLTSISGAMVNEMPETFRRHTEEMFWRALTSAKPLDAIRTKKMFSVGMKGRSRAIGRLIGGNLSLVAAMTGTPFFPHEDDLVYLLEELDERPYRIDRMLQQMKHNGEMAKAKGVVLGNFTDCMPVKGKPSLTLAEVFHETLGEFQGPILSGFRYGHVRNSVTFPLGVRVQLDGRRNELKFLESGVS